MSAKTITYTGAKDDDGSLFTVELWGERMATMGEAERLAGLFPKSCMVRPTGVSGILEDGRYGQYFTVHCRVDLRANGANKGVNETGVKRLRRIAKVCGDLGIRLLYKDRYKNGCDVEYLSRPAGNPSISA